MGAFVVLILVVSVVVAAAVGKSLSVSSVTPLATPIVPTEPIVSHAEGFWGLEGFFDTAGNILGVILGFIGSLIGISDDGTSTLQEAPTDIITYISLVMILVVVLVIIFLIRGHKG